MLPDELQPGDVLLEEAQARAAASQPEPLIPDDPIATYSPDIAGEGVSYEKSAVQPKHKRQHMNSRSRRWRQRYAWEALAKAEPWVWFNITEVCPAKKQSSLRRTYPNYRFTSHRKTELWVAYTGGFPSRAQYLEAALAVRELQAANLLKIQTVVSADSPIARIVEAVTTPTRKDPFKRGGS